MPSLLAFTIIAVSLTIALPLRAQEFESVDGAALFGQHCAHCHSSSVIEPGIEGLSKLDENYIYRTMWSGVMREAANGLDDAERRAIARVCGRSQLPQAFDLRRLQSRVG